MEISWLGHACVRVRTRRAAVVMDPADRSAGFDMGRPTADIVTVSRRGHPHHAHVDGVRGDRVVIDGPGEYEIGGVQVFGVASPLPREGDEPPEAARNTAFLLEAEGLRVAHLGGGCAPPPAEAELLSNAHILIVAIGGVAADPAAAARTVRDLEPTVVIPVGYDAADGAGGGEGGRGALGAFLEASGRAAEEPQPRFGAQARSLGDQQRAVLLEPRPRAS